MSGKETSTGTKLTLAATGEPSGRPVDRQFEVVGKRRRPSVLPDNLPPRGLSREQVAEYIGVSTTIWDRLVDDGLMPKKRRIYGRVVWSLLRGRQGVRSSRRG